jgi:CDP-paratose 2-epimerase
MGAESNNLGGESRKSARTSPSIVNLSGGLQSSRSLRQLSDWCTDRWGANTVASDPQPRPYDLSWVVLDHTLATDTWDWNPSTSTESILEEIARFADANPKWIEISR